MLLSQQQLFLHELHSSPPSERMEENRDSYDTFIDEVRERYTRNVWKRDDLRVRIKTRCSKAHFERLTEGFALSKQEEVAQRKAEKAAKVVAARQRPFTNMVFRLVQHAELASSHKAVHTFGLYEGKDE